MIFISLFPQLDDPKSLFYRNNFPKNKSKSGFPKQIVQTLVSRNNFLETIFQKRFSKKHVQKQRKNTQLKQKGSIHSWCFFRTRLLWRAGAPNFGNTAGGHDLASTIAVKIHGRGGHLRGWEIAVRHIFSQRIFGLGDSDRAEFHNCRRVSDRTGIAVDGGFLLWFDKNASARRICIIRPPEQTDF